MLFIRCTFRWQRLLEYRASGCVSCTALDQNISLPPNSISLNSAKALAFSEMGSFNEAGFARLGMTLAFRSRGM
jgi:hypothetical protein